ncbi:hypothetical protein NP493_766g00032 [Ridgeia piscesae]|uniref:Uncharacterized protein n=1 Tax=Ridgeia piscesae TaxID=27915 RepID=A0AAD9KQT1_RIDPI|nr:hypothetical protein NP493_766g00032 [Ridgeia piscesae]
MRRREATLAATSGQITASDVSCCRSVRHVAAQCVDLATDAIASNAHHQHPLAEKWLLGNGELNRTVCGICAKFRVHRKGRTLRVRIVEHISKKSHYDIYTKRPKDALSIANVSDRNLSRSVHKKW